MDALHQPITSGQRPTNLPAISPPGTTGQTPANTPPPPPLVYRQTQTGLQPPYVPHTAIDLINIWYRELPAVGRRQRLQFLRDFQTFTLDLFDSAGRTLAHTVGRYRYSGGVLTLSVGRSSFSYGVLEQKFSNGYSSYGGRLALTHNGVEADFHVVGL